MKPLRILILATGLLASAAALADQIVTLKTRANVTQSYLLLADGGAQPKAVAVMLPGGNGLVKLPDDIAQLKLGRRGNFLVRTRDLFRDDEVAVAIVDSPSDRQEVGMDDRFRASHAHVEDMAAVVKDLKERFPEAKIFIVGTSRGTLSAAYVARALGGPLKVDGAVLTATLFHGGRNGIGLVTFNFSAIPGRLLFVHHYNDACRATPFREADRVGRRNDQLMTVIGGLPAESDACGPLSAHGFYGKEAETVREIKNWIMGRPRRQTVG
jgi:hypothetical protein